MILKLIFQGKNVHTVILHNFMRWSQQSHVWSSSTVLCEQRNICWMPDILVFNHWFFCVNPAAVFSGLSHLSACTMRLTVPSFRSKISGVFQFLALKQHKSVSERAGTDWRETEGQEEQAPVDVTLQRGGDHQMTVSQRGFDDPISELQNIHCIIQHVSDLRNKHQ